MKQHKGQLTVREYDVLIRDSNIAQSLNGNRTYKVVDTTIFDNLLKSIRILNQQKKYFLYDQDNADDVLRFVELGYKRALGDTIAFKNYVGILQISSEFQIEILPKLSSTLIEAKNDSQGNSNEDFSNKETRLARHMFIKMLNCLRNFPGKQIEKANLSVLSMSLFEIFISMYIEEVKRIVKKGLASSYITNRENEPFLKGKLQLKEQVQYNLINQHKFYVAYDEWSINCVENQIIKTTLLFLLQKSHDVKNLQSIRNLLIHFEFVDRVYNYEKVLSKVSITRLKKEYSSLIEWSKIFLTKQGFSMLAGNQLTPTLLFPMERLFESYVAKYIKRVADIYSYTVSVQESRYWLFDTLNGESKAQFALKPDIVLRNQNDGCCIVADTKWKKLSKSGRNYGISQADLYQMFAYVKKYNAKEAWLLYPLSKGFDSMSALTFCSEDGVTVKVFFLDLIDIEKSLTCIFDK